MPLPLVLAQTSPSWLHPNTHPWVTFWRSPEEGRKQEVDGVCGGQSLWAGAGVGMTRQAPSLSSMVKGAQLPFLTVLKLLGKEASAMNPQWRSAALREEREESGDKNYLLESEWLTMRLLGASHSENPDLTEGLLCTRSWE